ncbi:MAG: mechanosensitive ion channel family protein, partial [Bacteroidia bacterium]|nr:mechanosensitive ion channel family protein [Bacteroidia bacterium]
IRTLDRTLISIPNKRIIDSELDNFTERTSRRVRQEIGILYETPLESIRTIIQEIKHVIDQHPKTTNEYSVTLNQFGDNALILLVIYFVTEPDFFQFLQIREEMNFKIIEIIQKNQSAIAYPTRTVHIKN